MKLHISRTVLIYLVISIAGVVGVLGMVGQLSAHAEDAGWLGPNVTAELDKTVTYDAKTGLWSNQKPQCVDQIIWVGNKLIPEKGCVYQAKSFRYASINSCDHPWTGCPPDYWSVIDTGNGFHKVGPTWTATSDCWLTSPVSDRIVSACGWGIGVTDDILSQLTPRQGSTGLEYDIVPNETNHPITIDDGQGNNSINAISFSDNGEWAAAELWGRGLFRIHLASGFIQVITTDVGQYGLGRDPIYRLSITNDGQYLAATGLNVGAKIYKIDSSCGVINPNYAIVLDRNDKNFKQCPSQDIWQMVKAANGGSSARLRSLTGLKFSDDGRTIELLESLLDPVEGSYSWWVKLSLPGNDGGIGGGETTEPTPDTIIHLKYLALGDSYSSGEGDITSGNNHYLPGTAADGQCHISDRSYPFLLRDHYDIKTNEMKSVACSGARVVADYIGTSDNYMGQGGILTKMGLTGEKLILKRQEALNLFTPGEVKQLDFVKKYQPDIITLTGGGNDVGFVRILEYCADGEHLDKDSTLLSKLPWHEYFVVPYTCDYAKKGNKLNKILYDSIDTQYGYDKILIDSIKVASPKSRIVIVGYPSFVVGGDKNCDFLAPGLLDDSERDMLNEAVNHMNQVLQALAHDAGVSYVNIEKSLEGGRICEKNGYVNSVKDIGSEKIANGDPSAFHPNATGHERIADKIIKSNVFDHPVVPERSSFTPRTDLVPTRPAQLTADIQKISDGTMKVSTEPGLYAPETYDHFSGYSDEVDLGTYMTNADGSLTATIPIGNMPPGLHVIVSDGTGVDGKPVVYYQIVEFVEPSTDAIQSIYSVDASERHKVTPSSHNSQLESSSNNGSSVLGLTINRDSSITDKSLSNETASYSKLNQSNKKNFILNSKYFIVAVSLLIMCLAGFIYIKQRPNKHDI